ncbi:MAG: zincin-like metallopeptidase domain-containing protein [Sphingobium sp.]|nr:zincin-like metallopeptidase domain-containing protein [Sphingobium sp.]
MADQGRAQRSSGKGGAGKAKAKGRTKQDARARHGAQAGDSAGGSAASRVSLYDEVTAKIIAQLEAGCFPWAQPWSSAAAVPGLPRNAVSGRAYSGVNVLILWGAVIEGCYPSQDWLTFRQALAAGGCVRKGERGHTVFYADRFTPEDGREQGEEAEGEPRSIPFLKRFVVFNAAQCDGLPARLTADPTPLPPREQHERAEGLIAATGADFRIGGARAFYDLGGDYVQVPPQPAFTHQIDFYRTALHELGHWAGSKERLAREQSGWFGSALYAREELCAELASAYLCAALGIVPTVRHADYLGSWLEIWRGEHIESNREVEVMWRNADLARESRTIPPVQGEPCSALF